MYFLNNGKEKVKKYNKIKAKNNKKTKIPKDTIEAFCGQYGAFVDTPYCKHCCKKV